MTVDDLARVITLAISLVVLVICVIVIRKDREAWRMVTPIMFWAASVNAWALTAMFVDPRPIQLINWWSRLNLWLAAVIILLLLALHYFVRKVNGNGGGGEKK